MNPTATQLHKKFQATLTDHGATKTGDHYKLLVGEPDQDKYLLFRLHPTTPLPNTYSLKNCVIELERFYANPLPDDAKAWVKNNLHPIGKRAMENIRGTAWSTLPGAGSFTALTLQRIELEATLNVWIPAEQNWQA